ncbi:MAG: hypothetical protein SOT18_07135 [Eubacterium sp.]|nr:hypothetical protein [Eubacterium sp.]
MKRLLQELHQGKNLDKNLKEYRDLALETYEAYSVLELTFSAYGLVEEAAEDRELAGGAGKEQFEKIKQGLLTLSDPEADLKKLEQDMEELRSQITEKMNLFTAYTDRLIVYEYVLNRMEYQYLDKKEQKDKINGIQPEEFLQKLQGYLFSDKDTSVMQEKIRLVVGQLPVRMTRDKFYDCIREAFTLYKGSDKASVDGFVYVLETAGTLYRPAESLEPYEDLWSKYCQLEKADYKNMDADQYEMLAGVLEEAAKQIHGLTDFYYSMQKVVNGIYAQCLLKKYIVSEEKLSKACQSIWKCLAKEEYREEMLVPLEGRIEPLVEKSSYLEAVLFETVSSCKEELEKQGLTGVYMDLGKVANLLSDSLFVSLEEAAEPEEASETYIQEQTKELIKKMDQKLAEVSKPVKRAIMGEVLEKLPMVFKSQDQVMETIRTRLFGCQDLAEQAVVVDLLNDWMRQEEW